MDERVHAQVDLLPTEQGGLVESMPLPTPSLILVFPSLDDESPGDVQIGGLLAASDSDSLRPGDTVRVEIDFWAEIGRVYATPGATFSLWYAGRAIGSGVVLRHGDDLNSGSSS